VWDGIIAGLAPIVTFEFEHMEQFFDPDFYAQGMTYNVTPAAGASDREFCEVNLRKHFQKSP
jgi:hypothetical protein